MIVKSRELGLMDEIQDRCVIEAPFLTRRNDDVDAVSRSPIYNYTAASNSTRFCFLCSSELEIHSDYYNGNSGPGFDDYES